MPSLTPPCREASTDGGTAYWLRGPATKRIGRVKRQGDWKGTGGRKKILHESFTQWYSVAARSISSIFSFFFLKYCLAGGATEKWATCLPLWYRGVFLFVAYPCVLVLFPTETSVFSCTTLIASFRGFSVPLQACTIFSLSFREQLEKKQFLCWKGVKEAKVGFPLSLCFSF